MSARTELAGILAQWRQLTHAEGNAIESSAWQELHKIQTRKAQLRQRLADAVKKCADEQSLSAFPFQRELGRIISLLTRNGERLAGQLSRARARQESLEHSRRNLQRIHRSYLPSQTRAAWHSYS